MPGSRVCFTHTISGSPNYEQFQITVSIDYLAMIIIGGLGSILGLDPWGAIFVNVCCRFVTRWFLEIPSAV